MLSCQLWSLRLSCLARLRLFNQTSAELNNLYTILTSNSIPTVQPISPLSGKPRGLSPKDYLWQKLVPFELEVLHAKTRYWAGDHMGYVDELVGLVVRCKRKAREIGTPLRKVGAAQPVRSGEKESERTRVREDRRRERESVKKKEYEREREMWKERGARVCLILASQLVEMKVCRTQQSTVRPEFYTVNVTFTGIYRSGSLTPAVSTSAGYLILRREENHIAAHPRCNRPYLPSGR